MIFAQKSLSCNDIIDNEIFCYKEKIFYVFRGNISMAEKHSTHHHDHDHDDHGHIHGSTWDELIHHIPYAVFSVAFCLILLSIFGAMSLGTQEAHLVKKQTKLLFHSFHFMHIVFAATGTLITFFRFSRNWWRGLAVGIISPVIFCTLSDSILPYLGGRMLGVDMHFHLCFLTELPNVLPFLFTGILNGVVMSRHHISRQGYYSVFSHFFHILISSLASSFYLVSHGYITWYKQIGPVFLFLVFAVVVPCTLADVVVPMAVARWHRKK